MERMENFKKVLSMRGVYSFINNREYGGHVIRNHVNKRYSFDKVSDMRNKLVELKEKHSGVDWSQFQEEF